MNYALNKPYQRLCMSRDLNGQRTKRAVISVCLSSKRCIFYINLAQVLLNANGKNRWTF